MMLYAVYKNGKADKFSDEDCESALKLYQKTGDISYLVIAHSVINVFIDKNLAEICQSAMEKDHPEEKFEIVSLHPISEEKVWE